MWIQDDLASRNGISQFMSQVFGSLLVFDHPWKWIRQNLIQNPKANGWLNPSQTLIGFKCGSWRSYQVRRSYRSLMLMVLRHLQRASFSFVSCEISWRSMRPASVSKITWSVFLVLFLIHLQFAFHHTYSIDTVFVYITYTHYIHIPGCAEIIFLIFPLLNPPFGESSGNSLWFWLSPEANLIDKFHFYQYHQIIVVVSPPLWSCCQVRGSRNLMRSSSNAQNTFWLMIICVCHCVWLVQDCMTFSPW